MTKKLIQPILAATLLCGGSSQAATLYNVDWGKSGNPDSILQSGAGAIGSTGDVWNTTDPELNIFSELENIIDSSGAASTVGVTWSDDLQSSVNVGAIEFGSTGHNALMEDYGFTHPGTTATVTVSGLGLNLDFTLYLYGVPDGGSQDTTFAVVGANEGAQTVTAGNTADDNGLNNPDDYVVFTGNTGAGGQIVYTQTGSSFSGSNGLQLEVVPEPSSLALFGMAGLLLARRRR